MICFSILVPTVDVIGNKERLWIGRLFIIDLSKHTLSPIDKWHPFQAANLLLILLTIVFHMRWRCTNRQAQIRNWHPLHPTYWIASSWRNNNTYSDWALVEIDLQPRNQLKTSSHSSFDVLKRWKIIWTEDECIIYKLKVSNFQLIMTKTNTFYKSQITSLFSILLRPSVAILKRDVDKESPLRNPFPIKNSLVGEPFTRIVSFVVEIHYCIHHLHREPKPTQAITVEIPGQ